MVYKKILEKYIWGENAPYMTDEIFKKKLDAIMKGLGISNSLLETRENFALLTEEEAKKIIQKLEQRGYLKKNPFEKEDIMKTNLKENPSKKTWPTWWKKWEIEVRKKYKLLPKEIVKEALDRFYFSKSEKEAILRDYDRALKGELPIVLAYGTAIGLPEWIPFEKLAETILAEKSDEYRKNPRKKKVSASKKTAKIIIKEKSITCPHCKATYIAKLKTDNLKKKYLKNCPKCGNIIEIKF